MRLIRLRQNHFSINVPGAIVDIFDMAKTGKNNHKMIKDNQRLPLLTYARHCLIQNQHPCDVPFHPKACKACAGNTRKRWSAPCPMMVAAKLQILLLTTTMPLEFLNFLLVESISLCDMPQAIDGPRLIQGPFFPTCRGLPRETQTVAEP